MKLKRGSRIAAISLSLILAFTMSMGSIGFAAGNQITLTPAKDGEYVQQIIDQLGGGDGLYKKGINGMDMFDNLGYVFMGWRTTGGTWQNQVINGFIMDELIKAGYDVTNDAVEAPYGTKSASDKSSAASGDQAWITQYQNGNGKNLGNVWDPEYSDLEVSLVKASDESAVDDADAKALAAKISTESWAFNPTKEVYHKKFAEHFGMDYEKEIASLPTLSEKIYAMHDVLMSSPVAKDNRTSVDDFTFVKRGNITDLNKEAALNKRTRLATNSCFTDPAGTDPEQAQGLTGEFAYVGTVNTRTNTNSEGIPASDLAGKIILTDSSVSNGFTYARNVGAVGVASKAAVPYYLLPKDAEGNILQPWYDSSRYAGGASLNNTIAAANAGTPIVEWQFSNQQYDATIALLNKAAEINATAAPEDQVKVMASQIAIGTTYDMNKNAEGAGLGQAVAMAEVKGTVHPEKRIIIAAHVQEPGCNDNATGAAGMLGVATAYKKLIDEGKIDRPKCTITFLWGDEMNLATYWMDSHPDEKGNVIGALDMDMTGEDPDKTGGVMRIEKTPDPSADYNYALDAVPWAEADSGIADIDYPGYDDAYMDSEGNFVRLPDSHTLWGAGETDNLFKSGWYLNDLYMYVTSTVIDKHDGDFRVDVCPYEGGSDHSMFLKQNIPAMLTWHFTDYTYHVSSDTLYMSSPREMESTGITTLATALAMSDMADDSESAIQILGAVKEAALKRMNSERTNTDHHELYVKAGNETYDEALANETEVLTAWADWYHDALESVLTLVDEPSDALMAAVASAQDELALLLAVDLDYANFILQPATSETNKEKLVEMITKIMDLQQQLGEAEGNTEALQAKIDKLTEELNKYKELENTILYLMAKAPLNPKAKTVTYNSVTIAWTPNEDASGYEVAVNGGKFTDVQLKTTFKKSSLKTGKKYTFSVKTYVTKDGQKVYGPENKVTATPKLAKAALKSAKNIKAKKIKATWKKVAGAKYYQVSMSKKKTGTKLVAKKCTKLTFTKGKLIKGKNYYVKVRAVRTVDGKAVYGKWSTVKKVKIRK